MKQYVLADDYAALTGMRLIGVDGTFINEEHPFLPEFRRLIQEDDLAILYIAENLSQKYQDEINNVRFSQDKPLISTLKRQEDCGKIDDALAKTIQHAIGMSI